MGKRVLFCLFIILMGIVTVVMADETRKVLIGKLNINEASSQDFLLLPGIGEKTAYRIVKYREEIGGFKAVAQIRRVKGVGDAVFNRIKDYLTLTDKSDLMVLIDINTATIPALTSLPGISERDANAIIEYRKRNKGFKKIEEISLAGISREKFEEIKDLITVLELEPAKERP
ncbi:MAG: ComEA family DNA-binding protein [Deltaproteobacteria bacterium]|nr:ComEA family DNA-binding protein [Deltaproteobacteria bacterium]